MTVKTVEGNPEAFTDLIVDVVRHFAETVATVHELDWLPFP